MGKGTFIERRNTRNDVNQNYGLNRVNKEGTTQYTNTPPGRSNINTPIDKYLVTDGGKLHAPVGFDKITAVIDVSETIDIAQGGANFVPRIVLDGTTSTTLDTIDNPLFEGQKIYVQAYSTGAITIGTAGNIQTGLTLTADHIIELIYDFDVGKWIMPEDNAGSGGSGEVFTWTADHSAAGFNLTNTNWVKFNASGTNDASIRASTDGFDYVLDSTSDEHDFFVGSAVAFEISSTSVTIKENDGTTSAFSVSRASGTTNFFQNTVSNVGRLDMDGNIDLGTTDQINFGSSSIKGDSSSNLEYSTTNTHEFFVGGTPQISVPSTGFKLHNVMNVNSNEIQNSGKITFASTGSISGSDVGWSSVTGDIYGNVQSSDSYFLRVAGTTEVEIDADGVDIKNGWLEMEERTAPSGLSNHIRLYAKDNGAGKTQLVVIFGSGAEQVIATQP